MAGWFWTSTGPFISAWRGATCLYFTRPDGYVGYRSEPAAAESLWAYIDRIFVTGMPAPPRFKDVTHRLMVREALPGALK